MIHFDPTISVGSLLSIGAFLLGLWKLSGRIAILEFKINELWRYKKFIDTRDSPDDE